MSEVLLLLLLRRMEGLQNSQKQGVHTNNKNDIGEHQ